jgi:uncharacterized protein
MANPFYNAEQTRIRAPWRIAIFFAFIASGYAATIFAMEAAGLTEFTQWSFTLVVAAAILMGAFILDKRPLRDFGFACDRSWWADLGFGIALGALLMGAIFAIELGSGMVRIKGFLASPSGLPFWRDIGYTFIVYAGVAFQEELIMRAYLMRNLAEGARGPARSAKAALWIAYVASSSVFGALHAGNPNASLQSVLLLVLAGLFLGLPYFLSGEMAIPIGLHFGWNFFQGSVFGFSVSGTGFGGSFIAIEQGGPAWFSGGAFGPEGGVAGVLAIVAGALLICLWLRRGGRELRPRWSLAEYATRSDRSRSLDETQIH